jgi:uncharacterized damage-inducible protein DinB
MSDNFIGDPGRAAPASKAELCSLIASGWDQIEQAIAALTNADLEERPEGAWSVADHLGHVAAWERAATARLQGRPCYAALGVSEELYQTGDDDLINAAVQANNSERPAPETLAELRDAHAELVAVLDGLSEEALQRTSSEFLPGDPGEDNGEPMRTRLVSDTYVHYAEHAAAIRSLHEQ